MCIYPGPLTEWGSKRKYCSGHIHPQRWVSQTHCPQASVEGECGCTFDNATKTWRRPSATVAERYAVDVLKARESARNARAVGEKDAIVDAIMAQVNAADAQRRDSTWVGMPCVPTREVNLERHAHKPPTSFG